MKAHRDPRRLTRASRTTSPYSSLLQSPCNRALRRVEQFPDGLLGALLCELPAVWRCARRVPSTACLLAEFPNPPSLSAPRTHALAVHIPVSRMVVMPDNSKNTLINSPSNGVWTSHLKLPHFRVLNQTCACCTPAPSAPVDHPLQPSAQAAATSTPPSSLQPPPTRRRCKGPQIAVFSDTLTSHLGGLQRDFHLPGPHQARQQKVPLLTDKRL